MQVVLVRVGIDAGSGGIQGPLFQDGSFEFVPIPDLHNVGAATYGNTLGRKGRYLSEYFAKGKRERMQDQPMHVDPDWERFSYGDPTKPKAVLRRLEPGDLLVFYCGLQGWDFVSAPALYLIGFFEVKHAALATSFDNKTLRREFRQNFHVRHSQLFEAQKDSLLLIKGTSRSRLYEKAHLLSMVGQDRNGQPLKVLSEEMQQVFGHFDGKIGITMSTPRWVAPEFVKGAAQYVRSLE